MLSFIILYVTAVGGQSWLDPNFLPLSTPQVKIVPCLWHGMHLVVLRSTYVIYILLFKFCEDFMINHLCVLCAWVCTSIWMYVVMLGCAFSVCMCLRGVLRWTPCAFHSHPPLNFPKQGLMLIWELVAWASPASQGALVSTLRASPLSLSVDSHACWAGALSTESCCQPGHRPLK